MQVEKADVMGRPRTLYFDTLTPELLAHVIRCASKKPYSDIWLSWVPSSFAFTLLQLGGNFKTETLNTINALSLCHQTSSNTGDFTPNALQCNNIANAERILLHVPSQLRTLAISIGARIHMTSFLNCRRLRRLVLDANSKDYVGLIAVCGRSLRELNFGYWSMPCQILDTVRLSCPKLERLSLSLCDVDQLLPLLEVVGGTLRSLRVYGDGRDLVWSESVCKYIADKCKVLEELEVPNGAGAKLYEELGPRLQVLHINAKRWDVDAIKSVLAKCPNARVDATQVRFTDKLRAVGSRARKLSVRTTRFDRTGNWVDDDETDDEAGTDGERHGPWEAFSVTFIATPKKHLRELILEDIGCPSTLQVIAAAVSTLHRLEFTTRKALSETDCYPIFKANKHLRSVRITICYGDVIDIECRTASLVSCLKHCAELDSFTVDCYVAMLSYSSLIADACVPLRWRRMSVNVGSVRYLPPEFCPIPLEFIRINVRDTNS